MVSTNKTVVYYESSPLTSNLEELFLQFNIYIVWPVMMAF